MNFKFFLVIFSLLYLKFDYFASAQSFFTVQGAINPNSVRADTGSVVAEQSNSGGSMPKPDTMAVKRSNWLFLKPSVHAFRLHLPLDRLHLTSAYGSRFHPVLGKWLKHNGVDLRADFQPVYSISFGIVERVIQDKRSGNYVVINNFNGIETVFCHLAKVLVKPGDTLKAGQPFAISGATGTVTGPHLHFGLKLKGKYINPLPLLIAIELKLVNAVNKRKQKDVALNRTY